MFEQLREIEYLLVFLLIEIYLQIKQETLAVYFSKPPSSKFSTMTFFHQNGASLQTCNFRRHIDSLTRNCKKKKKKKNPRYCISVLPDNAYSTSYINNIFVPDLIKIVVKRFRDPLLAQNPAIVIRYCFKIKSAIRHETK